MQLCEIRMPEQTKPAIVSDTDVNIRDKEMITFEEIVRKSQHTLKKALEAELNRMSYKPQTRDGFIYAEGCLPVMLVAHLDTVHKDTVETICYSPDGNIVMSPQGIGGDDRAGVYMILRISKKHRCHVLFCEDEEIGRLGARKFAESVIKPEINYIVELDRRGSNDAVFYDCDNSKFSEFFTRFRFKKEKRNASDIFIIAADLGVAAVNISAGFYNAHRKQEYVDLSVMEKNIECVSRFISISTKKIRIHSCCSTPE